VQGNHGDVRDRWGSATHLQQPTETALMLVQLGRNNLPFRHRAVSVHTSI
jgi:hypothetical protein